MSDRRRRRLLLYSRSHRLAKLPTERKKHQPNLFFDKFGLLIMKSIHKPVQDNAPLYLLRYFSNSLDDLAEQRGSSLSLSSEQREAEGTINNDRLASLPMWLERSIEQRTLPNKNISYRTSRQVRDAKMNTYIRTALTNNSNGLLLSVVGPGTVPFLERTQQNGP